MTGPTTEELTVSELTALLAGATDRLAATVDALAPETLVEASFLPGWSRAHVLTHLARNADGLRSLLLAARTGEPLRMYASPEARDADIETGATRPGTVVVADVLEASRRFAAETGAMPEVSWLAQVVFTSGRPEAPSFPARQILSRRLCEVEVHHVDLDAGYGFADTPEPLAAALLADWAKRIGASLESGGAVRWSLSVPDDDAVCTCRGRSGALLGWLAGRSDGAGIDTDGAGRPAVRVLP